MKSPIVQYHINANLGRAIDQLLQMQKTVETLSALQFFDQFQQAQKHLYEAFCVVVLEGYREENNL